MMVFCPRCLGKAGARKRRRVLLRLSVGWLPPSVPPSGAGLTLGSSILYKPLNAVEDCTTPGLRLCRCTEETFYVECCINIRLLTLRCYRNLVGKGPHEPNQLPGNSHHDLVGMFAACDESSIAFAQPDLGLPADILNNFRVFFEP